MESSIPVKKLAIVLQHASTGGWRYTKRLIEGLRQARPECEIVVYVGKALKHLCGEQSLQSVFSDLSVGVKAVPWLRPVRDRSGFNRIASRIRSGLTYLPYRLWVDDLNKFDATFFAWPYGIECPPCSTPVAFIPHDFNYSHFVGTFIESPRTIASLRRQHQLWLERAHPIVSTQFIADELSRTFPGYHGSAKVIRLAQLGQMDSLKRDEALAIVERLGIVGDYLLCLNNISAHKNLGQLLAGFHYVSMKYPDLKLVLVGFGTEGILGNVHTPYYLDWKSENGNVLGLGLRSDREVTALIRCAKLVVNASLYEAGNGSGLDAWSAGTPVAMSDIPAFKEQLQALDVRAETFNPRCCYEIRDALMRIIERPETAESNAEYSRKSMGRYTWKDVAMQYFEFFDALALNTNQLNRR